jgi:GDP-L-fucose synthase
MNRTSKIFVAGSNGLVGSAVVRLLKSRGFENILTTSRCGVSPIDLRNPEQVRWWFSCYEPDYVIDAAARVGGIKDNIKHPLAFFEDNIAIQQNIFRESNRYGVRKLLFLGSNCIYPRDCPSPIFEDDLLTGRLESTNEPYALAKIAGVKMCQWYRKEHGCNFVSAMPCNLYGPGDRFDADKGHLIPSMIARMNLAKVTREPQFKVWGDGTALRELLYSDDLARALLTIMAIYNEPEPINVGSGREYSIADIARHVAWAVDYRGEIVFDKSQPVGTPRKLLNNSKIFNLGWRPEVCLSEGLRLTYQDFLNNPNTRHGTR